MTNKGFYQMATSFLKATMLTLTVASLSAPIASATVVSDDSDAPHITDYYPANVEDSPMELNLNKKAYTYFAPGTKIVSNKARIVQNGAVIGTCIYYGSTPQSSNSTLDPSKAENAALWNLEPGTFTLEFYEVTYMSNGVEMTYTDETSLIGSVTYIRKRPNGTIVSETGIEDNTIHSYYPADGTDGVKTYTFDRAVIEDGIRAEFVYGMGDQLFYKYIPWILSEDGKTLTLDLRGQSYSHDDLAPGVTFVDEMGNPLPNPTDISISVDGLNCVDGTKIQTTSYSLDGMHSTILEGRIYQTYYYDDTCFPTPVLKKVEFYNSARPSVRYNVINDDTDMLALYVDHSDFIQSADMVLTVGTATATIPYSDITIYGNVYNAQIPESIKAAGSEDLTIGLANVTFTKDDGREHTIQPIGISDTPGDLLTISELKEAESGTKVILNAVDGIKVTLSNDQGYTFAEDATGGIQIVTEDYSKVLNEGTMVTGRLSGTYLGGGVLMLDVNASEYTEEPIDVKSGTEITSIVQLFGEEYYNCLLTFKASADMTITYDDIAEIVVIDDAIPVLTDFIEDLEIPATIHYLTGVLYHDPSMSQLYVIMRSNKDFNNGDTSIENIETVNTNTECAIYDVRGIKVGDAANGTTGLNHGVYIINGKKTMIK